jgi:predicted O-methyltransferase YrrM
VNTKIVAYTAIFGGYDDALEIHRPDPDLSYFLFTDGTIDSAPRPWQLRPLPAVFSDPQRDARRVKALPHLFLPEECQISVWVDGNCQIKDMTAAVILELLGDDEIALPAHAERHCVFAEGKALIASGLYDSPARIARQMSAYDVIGMPRDFGLHHTNFLIRRHNDPACIHFCTEWWQQINAHSKRDQLSFDFVRWKLGRQKVRTLKISYTDNHLFHCAGTHKSPRRIVSEHLESTVRCKDLPQSFLAAPYDPRFEMWPPQFLIHLRRLNEIVSETNELLEGNLCYFNQQRDFKYSPPDPRRGARWETYLRALAGRSRILEIGFNAGHSALLALTHSNATVTSIDDGSHAYTAPAAAYLRRAFADRLFFLASDSRRMPMLSRELGLGTHDMIHIDGGHAPEIFASDIATALTFSMPGTLVLIDDLYVPAIRQMTDQLVADGLLAQYGNLETIESGAYVTLETDPAIDDTAAHPALVNRLLNRIFLPRVSEETQSPFLSELLRRLDVGSVLAESGVDEAFGESNSVSGLTLRLDDELIDVIRRIGYHPFIIVRSKFNSDDARFLICHDENRIADFANGLMSAHASFDSLLLRAIERALRPDIATAAEMFFSWSTKGTRRLERIYLGLPPHVDLPNYYSYPIFEVAVEANGGDVVTRVQQLRAAFEAYYHAKGNDRSRLALLEALAVALTRWWGIHGQFDRAADIIARVLRINPTSRDLKAAINQLDLRSRAALNANNLPQSEPLRKGG